MAAVLALAATAYHAIQRHDGGNTLPDLVVGHGVLGRLVARLVTALGKADLVVWESNSRRASGGEGYAVLDPAADSRRDYRLICDVSGDAGLLDLLIDVHQCKPLQQRIAERNSVLGKVMPWSSRMGYEG